MQELDLATIGFVAVVCGSGGVAYLLWLAVKELANLSHHELELETEFDYPDPHE
ncbi:MAG TPA: hypothetical protein VKP88_00085 [Candidatus Paceibacterota bacterium]|nr:hypothetical protein [Candidatus Paceibacterota bacterium]